MPATLRSRPLPSLPTETHAHILSYCDAQTLGRASLVSLAFLELASPHLYGQVTITGFAQLKRMFYDDDRASLAPHLDRLLSLDQTHTFTFVGAPEDESRSAFLETGMHPDRFQAYERARFFNPVRLACSFPLGVRTLTVLFHQHDQGDVILTSSLQRSVLGLFSPEHAILHSPPHPIWVLQRHNFSDANWTRLRALETAAAQWRGGRLLAERSFFLQLTHRSVTLTYDLVGESAEDLSRHLFDLGDADSEDSDATYASSILALEQPQMKEIIFKVESNNQKAMVQGLVREGWQTWRSRRNASDRRR